MQSNKNTYLYDIMGSIGRWGMRKSEIRKLEDKDLQLRYFLSGLRKIKDGEESLCNFWACDINCSCEAFPEDERLIAVKKFIEKHNMTNERFLKLAYNYLIGAVMKYKGEYSPFFLELEEVIQPYQFIRTNRGKIQDNDFMEKELEELVINTYDSNSVVWDFIYKYNLTGIDFIVFAKVALNHNVYGLFGVTNPEDTFFTELKDIIDSYKLNIEYEYNEKEKNNLLVSEIRTLQKQYLELMKKLLTTDSELATEMIREELSELGFDSKKDIKRLVNKKK